MTLSLHSQISGHGRPVVFTHGWLNTGAVWAKAVAEVGDEARSLTWDLRGHGGSENAAVGDYGRSHALADLDRMVEAAGRPAVLVGHSLGGYLSLAYAILHPEQVCGLVLVAAGPGFRNPKSLEDWNQSVKAIAAKQEPPIPPGMEEISMHVDSLVIDRLGEITVPTAVVVGERDKRFAASADVFAKNLSVIHHETVADAGHMVHATHPASVAKAIRAVLAA